jgi:hypothetical protein
VAVWVAVWMMGVVVWASLYVAANTAINGVSVSGQLRAMMERRTEAVPPAGQSDLGSFDSCLPLLLHRQLITTTGRGMDRILFQGLSDSVVYQSNNNVFLIPFLEQPDVHVGRIMCGILYVCTVPCSAVSSLQKQLRQRPVPSFRAPAEPVFLEPQLLINRLN